MININYDEVVVTKDDFDSYENVRISGIYNMFDPRARLTSGLPEHIYFAIIKNYSDLSNKFSD